MTGWRCKFFVTPEYRERLDALFEWLNIFEVDRFLEGHEVVEVSGVEEIPPGRDAEDIYALDEVGWEVFVEHLPCYFTNIPEEYRR
ncbi:MAG: hypothetical protein JRD89_21195 [Deltaproteobacteria bacterium]|nr:hypothetical protein [Deltaproteobacteria bacterium]